jgi:hypothetical protein
MELVRRIIIFYYMREESHSLKRRSPHCNGCWDFGFDELSPCISFVLHMLGA